MLPRQAVRELCVAAAVFLLFWSGVVEAVIRASWLPLRHTRLFAILCCGALAVMVYLWAAPARPRLGADSEEPSERATDASYSSRR